MSDNFNKSSNKSKRPPDANADSTNKKQKLDITQQSLSKTNEPSLNEEEDTNTDQFDTTQTKNEDQLEYDFLLESYSLERLEDKNLRSWVWSHFKRFKINGVKR